MIKPMLANKLNPDKAKWPCFVQPKLDGVRCLHHQHETYTRNQKPHKDHIVHMINICPPSGWFLDGELMLPRPYTFQQTVSAVRGYNELSSLLEYHIYDICVPWDAPFRERTKLINDIIDGHSDSGLQKVTTLLCMNKMQFMSKAAMFISMGYEGAMYRTLNGLYKHGRSGRDLLKYKEFQDDEYKIVGWEEGQGKAEGTPTFICETADGKTFGCVPKGSYKHKRNLWKNRNGLIGAMLTVRFQELTDDGIPRFPVGVEVRDYE